MFLKATLAAANADEGRLKELHVEERSEYVELLKEAMMREGGSGDYLNEKDFTTLNEIPRMGRWLEEVGMAQLQQHLLFDALEVDGKIAYSEFLHVVERMSGQAHIAADLVIQLYQTRKTHHELKRLLDERFP